MKKLFIWLMVVVFTISIAFIGIGCKAEEPIVPAEEEKTEAEEEVAEEEVAEEEVAEEEVAEEDPYKDFKFGVSIVQHPYFAPVMKAVEDFMANTGIEVEIRQAVGWTQEEANEQIEALVSLGFNGIAMYPAHPVAVNTTITELVNKGVPVVCFAARPETPTDASLGIATDVKASAMLATEKLIEALGEKGNIVGLYGDMSDPNTVLRSEAAHEVADKYPEIYLIDELFNIPTEELAVEKLDSLLAARGDEIDGIGSYGYGSTVAQAVALEEMGEIPPSIKMIGIDDDPKVIESIKEGYLMGTMSQNPYAQAYLSLEALILLKSGYETEGYIFVDSGSILIDSSNVDNYLGVLEEETIKMAETFKEIYFVVSD